MARTGYSACVCGAGLLLAAVTWAQTPTCDSLSGGQRKRVHSLLASEHPYECCDDTISRCLEAEEPCSLAVRLAENICRRVAAGQDDARIRRSLSRRARSMLGDGASAEVDLSAAPAAGDAEAPATVVVYACARCPFCSRLVPELHEAVVGGALAGRARLVFRTFPIRGHEGSTEGGLAFTAASKMGRFWEYALYAYRHFDEFSPARLAEWATAVGLEAEAFGVLLADPETRESLVTIKKEGIVNGVEETPTVFINGRRWVGDLEIAEIIDAIEEEDERLRETR